MTEGRKLAIVFGSVLGVGLGLYLAYNGLLRQEVIVYWRRWTRMDPDPPPIAEISGGQAIAAGLVGLAFAALCGLLLCVALRAKADDRYD